MNVETTEINGFTIDTFNQYLLEEGKTQGICPLCSSDRKPSNQKTKCASYDWERGLGTCHNCNSTFQLHTYQRKGASDTDALLVFVRLVVEAFKLSLGGDGTVDLLLPGDARLPPVCVQGLDCLRPGLVRLSRNFPLLPGLVERGVQLLAQRVC